MYKGIKNITLCAAAITMALSVSACDTQFTRQLTKPVPWGMGKTPEGGSPTFTKGWEDGCESGMSVYGNGRYRAAYDFKQDLELIDNGEYYRAWRDGWSYCRWYAFNYVRDF